MRKLILLFLLQQAGHNCTAQSLTINNNSSCNVSFSVTGSDVGTCNGIYHSTGAMMLGAGCSASFDNTGSFSWETPPPVKVDWWGISILDDGQLKVAEADAPCSSLPQTTSYISPCNGATVNVTWTDNGGGSASVDIR